MRAFKSYQEEKANWHAGRQADRLINMIAQVWPDRLSEGDCITPPDAAVWHILPDGWVSSESDLGYHMIATGTWSDHLYIAEGKIWTSRGHVPLTPPDIFLICD